MGESGAECFDDVVSLGDIPSGDRNAGITVNARGTFRGCRQGVVTRDNGKLQQDCMLHTERIFRSSGHASYNKVVC